MLPRRRRPTQDWEERILSRCAARHFAHNLVRRMGALPQLTQIPRASREIW